MRIEEWANGLREVVVDFARDDELPALVLRVEPEMVKMAAQLVGALEDDEVVDAVVLGIDVVFGDALSFAASLETEVSSMVEESAEQLSPRHRVSLAPLRHDTLPKHSRLAATADYLGRVARGLEGLGGKLVLALKASLPEGVDPQLRRAALQELLDHVPARVLKFVLFDTDGTLGGLMARPPWTHATSSAALPRWFADEAPSWRHLLVTSAPDVILSAREHAEHGASDARVTLDAPFDSASSYARAALSRCEARLASPLSSEVMTLANDGARVVAALEQLAREAKSLLTVYVAPMAVATPETWNRFVRQLVTASVSPLVRYVVFDAPGTAPSQDATDAKPLPQLDVKVTPAMLRADLEARVDDPDADAATRCRVALQRAGFAIADDALDEAVGHAVNALTAADEAEDPTLAAMAWFTMGGAFHRSKDYDRARSAYAKAAAKALAHGASPLAAQALIGVGHATFAAGHHADAAGCYDTAARFCRRSGNVFGEALAEMWRGESEAKLDRVEAASEALRRALALYRAVSAPLEDAAREGEREALGRLLRVAQRTGDDVDDLARRLEALGGTRPLTDLPGATKS